MIYNWVDRDAELVRLSSWREQVEERSSGLCIEGEAGVGKSYLVRKFLSEERSKRDFLPLYLDFDVNLSEAISPLAHAINRLFRDDSLVSLRVKEILKKALPEILQEFPVVGRMMKTLATRGMSYQDAHLEDLIQRSEYSIVQIVDALSTLSKKQQLLLVLDNVQWVDRLSYAVVTSYLQKEIQPCPVLATLRSESLGSSSDEMRRARMIFSRVPFQTIHLESFDDETIQTFIARVNPSGLSVDPEAVRKIRELTGGLPLLVSCVATMDDYRLDPVEAGRGAESAASLSSLTLTSYFDQKLAALDQASLHILRFCACHGGPLHQIILDHALGRLLGATDTPWSGDTINELVRTHMLLGEEQDYLRFRHRLLRDHIYGRLSRILRSRYHSVLAEAILEIPDLNGDPELMVALARHSHLAGLVDRSITWAMRAAQEYLSLGLALNAKELFDLLRVAKDPSVPPSTLAKAKELMIRVSFSCGDFSQAVSIAATVTSEEAGELTGERLLAQTLYFTGMSYYYLNQSRDAVYLFGQGAEVSRSENNQWMLHANNIGLAACLDLAGEYARAASVIEESSRIAGEKCDDFRVAKINMIAQMVLNEPEEVLVRLRGALTYFTEASDERHIACSLNNLGLEYLMRGEIALARRYLEDSVEWFRKFRGMEINFPYNNLGIALRYSGDLELSLHFHEKAFFGSLSTLQRAFALTNLGVSLAELGEPEKAAKELEKAYSISTGHVDPTTRIYTSYNLARLQCSRGKFAEALALVKESLRGPWKDQLKCLIDKRQWLVDLCVANSCADSPFWTEAEPAMHRRALFARDSWEPAELVFFT